MAYLKADTRTVAKLMRSRERRVDECPERVNDDIPVMEKASKYTVLFIYYVVQTEDLLSKIASDRRLKDCITANRRINVRGSQSDHFAIDIGDRLSIGSDRPRRYFVSSETRSSDRRGCYN